MNQNNVSKAEIQGIFAEGAGSYLERYPTNKQQRKAMYAIINSRILSHQNGSVTFRWKDYRSKACWIIPEIHTRKCPKCQVGTLKFFKLLLSGAG